MPKVVFGYSKRNCGGIRPTARHTQMHRTHPDAPHFDRNASHSADRYVCECEGWEPPKREWVGLTKEDFYKKDDETVFVLGMKFAEARLKEKNT
jgi:hypothetical protein